MNRRVTRAIPDMDVTYALVSDITVLDDMRSGSGSGSDCHWITTEICGGIP